MNEVSLRMIEIVARGLGELNDHVAFVGGAVAGVYADDPASEDARPTTDVDCVLQLGILNDQYALEESLCRKHFQHDIESGVICRWIYQGITVDIMPDDGGYLVSPTDGTAKEWSTESTIRYLTKRPYTYSLSPIISPLN